MSARSPDVPSTISSRAGGRSKVVRALLVGACVGYVAILLLLPLSGILWTGLGGGAAIVGQTLTQPDVRHAFALTAVITVITVIVTSLFGLIVSWVLVRQRFVGRSVMNALVDLPFALSPVTVGLACVLLFGANGWFAEFFEARGIQIIFALPSMVLVTIFICVPFTIRELVPVLEEIGLDEEDAARTLGASLWQTFFRVTLPNVRWAFGYGIALTTARAIGEIGAVLIVSGLIRGKTETATIYVFSAIEERQNAAAAVVALTLACISVVVLIVIEGLRRRTERVRTG